MIKNFLEIKNIGKFVSPKNLAGRNFLTNTVIFGKNTYGKSTLSSIFRSIKFRDPIILQGKKTIRASGKPEVKIRDDGGIVYEFDGQNWTSNIGQLNIDVFDSTFVDSNIYSGEKITNDHHDNLNKLILGKVGVDKQKEIDSLTSRINEISTEKNKLSRGFGLMNFGCSLEQLRNIKVQTPNLKEEIELKRNLINQSVNSSTISEGLNTYIQKINIDFPKYRQVLAEKLEVDFQKIKEHLSKASKNVGLLKFIEEGLSFQKTLSRGSNCVLCGQEIGEDSEKIFVLFQNFFKSQYKTVNSGVKEAEECLARINLESCLSGIANIYKEHKLAWDIQDDFIKRVFENFENTKIDIENKIKDLESEFSFINFDSLETGLAIIRDKVETTVSSFGLIKSQGVLEMELGKLEMEELKSGKCSDLCKQYDNLEDETQKLQEKRAKIMEDLDREMDVELPKILESLNTNLVDLRAGFKISKLENQRRIRSSDKSLYSIDFNGVNVPLNHVEGGQCFRNVLSDSDKKVLALAFFLATTSSDNSATIVLDDPVNSFDNERKRAITKKIGEMAASGKQIIILTHDVGFLREINIEPSLSPNSFLVINHEDDTSYLDDSHSIHDYLEDNHLRRIKHLIEMKKTSCFDNNFEAECRKLLEHIFELKHTERLSSLIGGANSFTSYARVIFAGDQNKLNDFDRLGNYLHIPLHDGSIPNLGIVDNDATLDEFFKCLQYI